MFGGIGNYVFSKVPNINFMKYRFVAYAFFASIVLTSIGSIIFKGFNYDIDFKGGVSIEVEAKIDSKLTIDDLRKNLNKFSPEIQQKISDKKEFTIRVGGNGEDEKFQKQTIADIKNILGEQVSYRNVVMVGPKIGPELVQSAVLATIFALLAIAFYVGIRFETPYAVCGILALAHDVITTFGLFSITQMPFNLNTIAAVLTIAGYSINDTVVEYDRLKENIKKYPSKGTFELINLTINEMLGRTLLTSGATSLAVFAFYFWGGDVLHGFSTAMVWGMIAGCASSLYIAMPLLAYFKLR